MNNPIYLTDNIYCKNNNAPSIEVPNVAERTNMLKAKINSCHT